VALRPWVSPGVPFSTVIPVYACRKPVSRKLARRQWRSDIHRVGGTDESASTRLLTQQMPSMLDLG
jgi:hypothetical protein